MYTFIENKIQRILNRYIALDPESPKRLAALSGKIVTLDLNGPIFQLHFTDTDIQLNSTNFAKADTIIKGSPLSLLHLSLSPNDRKKFFAEDISIEGNIELGQQVIALFDELNIDWEEHLSHWVGDVPAHNIGHFAANIKKFSKKLRETLLQNINEYTHEEIQLFPPAEELQDFFQEVDKLRMDVDRLEARINKLIQSIDVKKKEA